MVCAVNCMNGQRCPFSNPPSRSPVDLTTTEGRLTKGPGCHDAPDESLHDCWLKSLINATQSTIPAVRTNEEYSIYPNAERGWQMFIRTECTDGIVCM